jgi:ABC transporter substrate binding protein
LRELKLVDRTNPVAEWVAKRLIQLASEGERDQDRLREAAIKDVCAADYVVKIFKGAKATDLAVEQATKFELVVNLKTANAIGVTLPTSILLRADEVIE